MQKRVSLWKNFFPPLAAVLAGMCTTFLITFSILLSLPMVKMEEPQKAALLLNRALPLIFLALIPVAVLLFSYSKRQTRGMTYIQECLKRFSSGNFDFIPIDNSSGNISLLCRELDKAGKGIGGFLNSMREEKNELEAILESMAEAVIVLDSNLLIEKMNSSARNLLYESETVIEKKSVLDAFRNSDLHHLTQRVIEEGKPCEQEIVFYNPVKRYLQTRASLLRENDENGISVRGVILVLHDITRIKELERVRKEFVANVSHELKTPITSIVGFVETLLSGAVEDNKLALHFLSIIDRQVKRINSIIDDLLSLSRLEQVEEGNMPIALHLCFVKDIVSGAVRTLISKAAEKMIEIVIDCPSGLKAGVNPQLLEQAVANLVDNAIKYSSRRGKVVVLCTSIKDEIKISVKDNGCGIPGKHLARIFERFYRVDKSRSKALGGTGLGLSIVKHIALVHGGNVSVKSIPGKGSTFTITLKVGSGLEF